MKKIYKIDAVHDILKRVIESNLDDDAMVSLYKELQNAGYEDKNIILETTKEIYQSGDTIMITKEMFDSLPTDESINYDSSPKERYQNDARKAINYIFGENPNFPITGEFKAERIDHKSGNMIVKWHTPSDKMGCTNSYFLEYMGFEIEQPEFDEIPIAEADDSLLSDGESVLKYLIIQNDCSQKDAEQVLDIIYKAMNKAGAVFYRP